MCLSVRVSHFVQIDVNAWQFEIERADKLMLKANINTENNY